MLLSISVILLTISLYFLMGFFMQERQDNRLQQELQELMQKKEDELEEDASAFPWKEEFSRTGCVQ